jgi:hypothetical protein
MTAADERIAVHTSPDGRMWRYTLCQVGWRGQSGAFYELGNVPYGRERGGFSPMWIIAHTDELDREREPAVMAPSIGRIVHYVGDHGDCQAAIITGVGPHPGADGSAHMTVFYEAGQGGRHLALARTRRGQRVTTLVHLAAEPEGGRQVCSRCRYELLHESYTVYEAHEGRARPAWFPFGVEVVEESLGGALVDVGFLPPARRAELQLVACRGLT